MEYCFVWRRSNKRKMGLNEIEKDSVIHEELVNYLIDEE